MVILSCLAIKSIFEFEEKKSSLLLKVAFSRQKHLQTSVFSNKLNTFSSNPKILVVLEVVDMRQLLLRNLYLIFRNKLCLLILGIISEAMILFHYVVYFFQALTEDDLSS